MEHPLKFPIRMAEKKKENVRFWTNTIQKSAVMSITFVNLQNVWKRSEFASDDNKDRQVRQSEGGVYGIRARFSAVA